MSDGINPPDPSQPHQPPVPPQQPGQPANQPPLPPQQPGQPVPQPPDNLGLNMGASASAPAPAPPKKSLPWGWIIRIGIGVVVLAGIGFTQCGKTTADDLELGDCFEIPDEGDFSRVTDQNCAEPHEAEIYARAPLSSTFGSCESLLIDLIVTTTAEIPDDVSLGEISVEDEVGGWCVVTSDSGQLVGSVRE